MNLVAWIFKFSLLDEQIEKIRALRDSLRQANADEERTCRTEIPDL